MDTLQAVAQKLSKDPAVWTRVQSELAQAQDPRARLLELARENGLTIDANELDRVVAAASRELNEKELESVAGGLNPLPGSSRVYSKFENEGILIGLLLPAVQKVNG
jgi:hypothetical protein